MLRISIGIIVALAAAAGVVAAILLYGRGAPYTEIVQTTSGPIRGEELSFAGTNYKAFKGIPYAAAPVGDLRFRDPQPPEKWTTVRDTRQYGKICKQANRADSSEDCLTLNVFTPSLGENGVKPVLVWIHGGAFVSGDGTDSPYGPQYLLQEDIVVVTLNYRLGPLGFLSTNSPDASGNWGMKDQVAALRWVHENIANFGGDPKQVTIYGESAGGASVHLHLLSPLSKGLFHKVIAASGTGINSWSVASPEQASEISIKLARGLGASEADTADPAKRIEFLRRADADAMIKVQVKENSTNPMNSSLPYTPVIENSVSQGAFLTERPRKMVSEGRFTKMPIIIGATNLEGAAFNKIVTPEGIRFIEKNVCAILPEDLKKPVLARNDCAQVAQEIRNAYFGGKPFDSSTLNFTYLASDIFMTTEVYLAQRLHSRFSSSDNPIYSYIFAFDGEWNLVKKQLNITLPGATHGDDLGYVFKPVFRKDPSNLTPEVITKNRMVRLIGNFVKYGNPTPSVSDLIPVKWEPSKADASKTLVIGNDLIMENYFLKTRMGLWDKLYEKYTGSPLFA